MYRSQEPFLGAQAVAERALTRHQLDHDFTRLYRNVYLPRSVPITAALRARAAWLYSGERCVLTGFSAAALHGSKWINQAEPAEVIRAAHFRAPAGMLVHNCRIADDEVLTIDRMRVATPARAAFDLGRRLGRRDAVVALDALCNATGLPPAAVALLAGRHAGMRGVGRLRRVLDLVDGGAQSPPETDTRLVIVDAGLPRPQTQIPIVEQGREIAYADLGWRAWSVLVEYDGDHHWLDRAQRAWDIERLARVEAHGWTVVRVGAELLYDRPRTLVERVRTKLRAAGAPV